MEAVIGYTIVGLFLISIFLFVIKILFIKKKSLRNEDEIILDKNMVHYGPFTGNKIYPGRKFILLLAVSSSFLTADIEFNTVDNWRIFSWGEDELMIQKKSTSRDSSFYIEMDRPFCICADPLITTPINGTNYNQGDKIEATIAIDNNMPEKILFTVNAVHDNGFYILRPDFHPSFRDAKSIKIKFDRSSNLETMLFNTKGIYHAMKQSERICMSGYELQAPEIKETSLI